VTRRRLVRTLTVLVVAGGLAGCGVSAQSSPHEIDKADVPFGLTERANTPTTLPSDAPYSYTIFLVSNDQLRAVSRGSRTEPTPISRLDALTDGPTPTEADAGLSTLVGPDVTVERVHISDQGVATVELSGEGATQSAGNDRALAIAQLVYTATAIPGVERVRFEVAGKPTEVPRGDGTLTSRAVSRADYGLNVR
jgi:Sporulation and spore germination